MAPTGPNTCASGKDECSSASKTTDPINGTEGRQDSGIHVDLQWDEASSSALMDDGGVGSGDLPDSDEEVLKQLAEFTELARHTAVQNEKLSRNLTEERRKLSQARHKLEQCRQSNADIQESLDLSRETVLKLREHERKWADSTASEMTLRAELSSLKDSFGGVVNEVEALQKRCALLERENANLGTRYATVADEKRKVEARARRLLKGDRFVSRGFK